MPEHPSPTQPPSGSTERPSGGTERPSGGTERPSGSTERPSGGVERPSGATGRPSGATRLKGPAEHTAEDATVTELRRASLRLLLMLLALAGLVVPLLRELPLGQSTRSGLLAWLLVALALYWLYAGMGYRPLLLVQMVLFSSAAALLSAKLMLVAIDLHSLSVLRHFALVLIILGAACAAANLGGMLVALARREAAEKT
jgi:hypothetical protein